MAAPRRLPRAGVAVMIRRARLLVAFAFFLAGALLEAVAVMIAPAPTVYEVDDTGPWLIVVPPVPSASSVGKERARWNQRSSN